MRGVVAVWLKRGKSYEKSMIESSGITPETVFPVLPDFWVLVFEFEARKGKLTHKIDESEGIDLQIRDRQKDRA